MTTKYRYEVVTSEKLHSFEEGCQNLLDEGYNPQGGIAVRTNRYGDVVYYQAFVKIEQELQG